MSRHRVFEYQDKHGRLWQVEMVPNRPIPCLDKPGRCGRATEVHAACDDQMSCGLHMFIDEVEDPQVAVDAVLRELHDVPRDPD